MGVPGLRHSLPQLGVRRAGPGMPPPPRRTTHKRSILLFTVGPLLVVGLSGCSGPAPPFQAAATVIGSECLGAAEGKCEFVGGTLFLRGLTLSGQNEGLGLLVDELTASLVLEGLNVTGFSTAVHIDRTCSTCQVDLTNASIQARNIGVEVGYLGPTRAALTLRQTNVTMTREGNVETLPGGVQVRVDAQGILIYDLRGGLVLDRVNVLAPSPSMGRAVWDRGSTTLEATSVSISGFGRAIIGNWTSLRMRDVKIDCDYDAIWTRNPLDVDVDGLEVNNCGRGIGECRSNCTYGDTPGAPAVELGGDFSQKGPRVLLRNLTMTNNIWALGISKYQVVKLEQFRIDHGVDGLVIGGADNLVMENGTVAHQERHGVAASVDKLRIRHVTFDHNGFGPSTPSHGNHGGLDVQAHTVNDPNKLNPGPRSIQQSSFTRNTPFGLMNDFDDPFDASYNWWGSPLGPSPGTPEAAGNPPVPGFGDMTAGAAITEPHLTAPP